MEQKYYYKIGLQSDKILEKIRKKLEICMYLIEGTEETTDFDQPVYDGKIDEVVDKPKKRKTWKYEWIVEDPEGQLIVMSINNKHLNVILNMYKKTESEKKSKYVIFSECDLKSLNQAFKALNVKSEAEFKQKLQDIVNAKNNPLSNDFNKWKRAMVKNYKLSGYNMKEQLNLVEGLWVKDKKYWEENHKLQPGNKHKSKIDERKATIDTERQEREDKKKQKEEERERAREARRRQILKKGQERKRKQEEQEKQEKQEKPKRAKRQRKNSKK